MFCGVSARRLEVYEAEKMKAAGRSVTLKSACSGRSLSCKHSSVSLHTLTAEQEEDEEDLVSSHSRPRTSAFCSRVVRL